MSRTEIRNNVFQPQVMCNPDKPTSWALGAAQEKCRDETHGKSTKIDLVPPWIRSYSISEHESVGRQHLLLGKHVCNSAIRGSSKSGWAILWKNKSLPIGKDEQL